MLRDWLELIRLPNVFTAMADVVMGFFFVTPLAALDAKAAVVLGLLLVVSSLLYSVGTIVNDVFDYQEDSRDRPERPIPSGRISREAASGLGLWLVQLAVIVAIGVSWVAWSAAPWQVAGCLLLVILAYDLYLKRTVIGPVLLGACRGLNVLLGMSAAGGGWAAHHFYVAAAIGLFVVGISVMARGETRRGARAVVLLGVVLMMAAVGVLVWLPNWRPILVAVDRWWWIVAFLALLVAWRCSRALVDPSPAVVQSVVGQSLRSLVVLDAVITVAVAGIVPGVAVLALLVPSTILSRSFYST